MRIYKNQYRNSNINTTIDSFRRRIRRRIDRRQSWVALTAKRIIKGKYQFMSIIGHQTWVTRHPAPVIGHRSPGTRHSSSVPRHLTPVIPNRHRIIALFFVATFIQTLIPYNQLRANNNGPKAPEAASFEPVDATDMVNLVTGDMSYVLPLLNIPSPEGGYPLALSYHAGVAMNQEASWVGLGWTLNPGAINRSLNKIPDDWNNAKTYDIVFDKGGFAKNYRGSINVGVSDLIDIGVYYSYSEHKAYNGENGLSVSNDFGLEGTYAGIFSASLGTDGASVGLKGGSLNLTVSQSFKNSETSVRLTSHGGTGISLSSRNGLRVSMLGNNYSLNNENNGSKSINTDTDSGRIQIPIIPGILSIGGSYQFSKYWLYEKDYTINQGSLYSGRMNNILTNSIFESKVDFDGSESYNVIKRNSELPRGNFTSVNYDSYSVSGQGIAGSLTPQIIQEGYIHNKIGLLQDGSYNYFTADQYPETDGSFTKNVDGSDLNDIHFYLSNEYSSYLSISSGNWKTNLNNPANIFSYNTLNNSFDTTLSGQSTYNSQKNRLKKGNYVEVFTNKEIINNPNKIVTPKYFERSSTLVPEDGIGAYKITAIDGKTYHYSIPVYQREKIYRVTSSNTDINDGFSENQQLDPYATHWLLTAITGPDYIDADNDNSLSKSDKGYWVEFEYGKWSDGYSWRTPKEGTTNFENTKYYSWGLKDIYYLDKVKTRTHTALFLKEDRKDDFSSTINIPLTSNDFKWYKDVHFKTRVLGNDGNTYLSGVYDRIRPVNYINFQDIVETEHGTSFHIGSQKSLRLKTIVVIDNNSSFANVSKSTKPASSSPKPFGGVKIIENYKIFDVLLRFREEGNIFTYERDIYGEDYNKVLDIDDINSMSDLYADALEVIDLGYDESYPLSTDVNGTNGKLTLKSVNINGKNNSKIIPPYKFDYNRSAYFDKNKIDPWGFHKDHPNAWSLNKITTPIGTQIKIEYESDTFHKEVANSERVFNENLRFAFKQFQSGKELVVETTDANIDFREYFETQKTAYVDALYWRNPPGTSDSDRMADVAGNFLVTNVTKDQVTFKLPDNSTQAGVRRGYHCNEPNWVYYNLYHKVIDVYYSKKDYRNCGDPRDSGDGTRERCKLRSNTKLTANDRNGGGIRVKSISLQSNESIYTSEYSYINPTNNKSSGVTTYAPEDYTKSIDFINELPPPMVMYKNVKVAKYSANQKLTGYTKYTFNTPENITYTEQGFELDDFLSLKLKQNDNVNDVNLDFSGSQRNVDINFTRHELIDNTSAIGSLANLKQYNSENQLISYQENEYSFNENQKQGVIQESSKKAKLHIQSGGKPKVFLNTSNKKRKQSILIKTHVLQNNFEFEREFIKHDHNTGLVIEETTTNSNNIKIKNKVIPAYTIHEYSGMGSKADNPTNKNMLTQTAASLNQIKDATGNWKTINAGINTWNNSWTYRNYDSTTETPGSDSEKIWRKHQTFVRKGDLDADGAYLGYTGDDDNFNWSNPNNQSNTNWIKTSEVSLYDHFSMPLESIDINQNSASTKMSIDETKVEAVSNSKYTEQFYAGVEYRKEDNANYIAHGITGGAYRSNVKAHTGNHSLALNPGNQGFKVTMVATDGHRADRYKVSVWVYKDNAVNARIHINGSSKEFNGEKVPAGDWTLLNHYEQLSSGEETVYITSNSGTIYADDFRLHPANTSMTSYVYNQWDELTYIIGTNNLATQYSYDGAGRLSTTWVETIDEGNKVGGFKKSQTTIYNYKK